jgi:hypothetical protein
MFANKIVDGKPICPMKGCHLPVTEPGGGQVWEISKETANILFSQGVIAKAETLVIIHKHCA